MNSTTFTNEIFNNVNFNQMRKFKNELSRGVKNNETFTNMICNNIIGILTPWANGEVHGVFYAEGKALKNFIRKAKQILGMWNFNCVLDIDENKKYEINNTFGGFIVLNEVH